MKNSLSHYEKVEKPWGNFERFTYNEPSTVKILTLNPGQEFSLQRHGHRGEYWRVLSGSGTATIGESQSEAHAGDEFYLPAATLHRLLAGREGIKILEISFGEFDENDIERLADDYGRA